MSSETILNLLEVHERSLPTPKTEGDEVKASGDRYGGAKTNIAIATKHNLAAEGCYCVATNPTPGTPVAYGSGTTQGSFSDTVSFMVFKNNYPASETAKRMYFDYIKLIVGGTVPASSTGTQYVLKIDNVSRLPTANFTAMAPVNVSFAGAPPAGQMWVPSAGTITTPASGASARIVSRGTLRSVISVFGDEYILRFGSVDGSGASSDAGAGRYVSDSPPIILGPQEWMVFHLWQPSGATNPLSVEFEAAWWER